jgi:alpha/beta superfamily hydrolase
MLRSDFLAAQRGASIPGPVGAIELVTASPERPRRLAVVCHPHPLYGGSMQNKVVTTCERTLRELGCATVRFNFRGVGASAGRYDHGRGEVEDLAAVVEWATRASDLGELWLAGFSFGSYIAAHAAAGLGSRCLVSIAPPVESWDFRSLSTPPGRWLVVQGEADEICAPEAVYRFAAERGLDLVRIPDASHFFHGRLTELREALRAGLAANAG